MNGFRKKVNDYYKDMTYCMSSVAAVAIGICDYFLVKKESK